MAIGIQKYNAATKIEKLFYKSVWLLNFLKRSILYIKIRTNPVPREPRRRSCIQLFRERSSEKVHATIPKGIVGGFEFNVLQRNLKEWHERPWTSVCKC